MFLSSGIKFRCYPTDAQKLVLSPWMGCQRVIYNAKVAEDKYFRAFSRKSLPLAGINPPVDQQYAHFKDRELTPYLYEVPSRILRNGATRFMSAYHRYCKGLAGRPAFKNKHRKQSVWITSELFRFKAKGSSKNKQERRSTTTSLSSGQRNILSESFPQGTGGVCMPELRIYGYCRH